jgi:3-hydroxybutyryl-CoA dehydrogenase
VEFDVESIDKTWMITMGNKMGPLVFWTRWMQTAYNVSMLWGTKLGDQKT